MSFPSPSNIIGSIPEAFRETPGTPSFAQHLWECHMMNENGTTSYNMAGTVLPFIELIGRGHMLRASFQQYFHEDMGARLGALIGLMGGMLMGARGEGVGGPAGEEEGSSLALLTQLQHTQTKLAQILRTKKGFDGPSGECVDLVDFLRAVAQQNHTYLYESCGVGACGFAAKNPAGMPDESPPSLEDPASLSPLNKLSIPATLESAVVLAASFRLYAEIGRWLRLDGEFLENKECLGYTKHHPCRMFIAWSDNFVAEAGFTINLLDKSARSAGIGRPEDLSAEEKGKRTSICENVRKSEVFCEIVRKSEV